MTTANGYADMPEPIHRRLGLPFLLDDGRTIPESLVHLAKTAIPALEKDRDIAAARYATVAAEYEEVKSRFDAAQRRWLDAVEQIELTRKFADGMGDIT